ncbi:MAG: Uma2 family endonuclease [Spirosomataceae bacterium]
MKTQLSAKPWTYQEMLAQLPAESRYELRDANLIEMPSPKPKHQRIVFKVGKLLDNFVQNHRLGEVFLSPLDVVFQQNNVVQPDLIFVANDNRSIINESYLSGAPDLLVEVVSKGSVARDYIEKKNDYEKFGVKEYWIIDSLNETIWIYALDDAGKYAIFSYAEEGASAQSKLFADFSLAHSSVFEE